MRINRTPDPAERRVARRVGCRLQMMTDPLSSVTDISETGARFSLHHAVSLNEDFDVPIRIDDRIVWARVKPVWVRPAAEPHSFHMGATFTGIHDEDKEIIRRYVDVHLQKKAFGFFSRIFAARKAA